MAEIRKRKPRADAQKNRELLLEAAKDVLGRGGPNASLEAVARRAGVGIGTLYRHFPTREELFMAVFSRELDQLIVTAEDLVERDAPLEAIRSWLHANVDLVETKRGMLGAMSLVMTEDLKQGYTERSILVRAAVDQLLDKGRSIGEIREGFSAEDLMQTLYAICYARQPGPDWRENVLRILDIFVDGLKK
ncbi:TetR/AcrR family transcriptional regulator [Sulfitobacter pseudonitzschiae]|uniref:TetR/AcrR family transcriptional regulator n=1 Tax=Pseudosulfitobacter pseudonitzschiae TaxID=1402135 RepID=A0A9Q2RV82_9RHOB|nr:TetR/AcrR family transcriptional regulator [Pseudosulfitobacter pseudonitzschiae]MBM2293094.1 TetR/AcrR family transcriptional regulator [Pseudosulfitobacter pseudonitzschiae]MBM2297618.1 TetR/AcrR family transcriptional regulator [Pseudosulfitobacter pseudonitzschiae]MBM2302532.1 TetR/AcrR family transcriptional regulator [Pseudosulfitobacter pseudonitzschiae]MBM2312478.1 TetR/AcrR family transcriptional regulator [Pseudosulfitobacter pseudonitzschiae]MBM2317228.1 TetR/AcrR family transcri